ncbi:hypothetical protein ACF07S_10570 [Streptomyces sp. NPDC016640]
MNGEEQPKCCLCNKPIRGMVYSDTITGQPMDVRCWDRENEY